MDAYLITGKDLGDLLFELRDVRRSCFAQLSEHRRRLRARGENYEEDGLTRLVMMRVARLDRLIDNLETEAERRLCEILDDVSVKR